MAHTPGPWHVSEMVRAAVVIGNDVIKLGFGDESKSNARLIAAAPDLLESIKNYFEVYENRDSEPGWVKRVFDAKAQCMAAIAKATGGQQ